MVNAVSITPRADCCWESTAGAIVMVGNTTWTGSGSRKSFTECGRVPSTISRGQRITVTCSQPLEGSYVAVYLPKVRTSLTLCEVDAAIGAASGGSSLGGRKRLLGQVSSRN